MDTYSLLRELADSYAMAILFAIFVGVVLFAFRPGSRAIHDDAAAVPFRHDRPAGEPCFRACQDCACAPLDFLKEYRDV